MIADSAEMSASNMSEKANGGDSKATVSSQRSGGFSRSRNSAHLKELAQAQKMLAEQEAAKARAAYYNPMNYYDGAAQSNAVNSYIQSEVQAHMNFIQQTQGQWNSAQDQWSRQPSSYNANYYADDTYSKFNAPSKDGYRSNASYYGSKKSYNSSKDGYSGRNSKDSYYSRNSKESRSRNNWSKRSDNYNNRWSEQNAKQGWESNRDKWDYSWNTSDWGERGSNQWKERGNWKSNRDYSSWNDWSTSSKDTVWKKKSGGRATQEKSAPDEPASRETAPKRHSKALSRSATGELYIGRIDEVSKLLAPSPTGSKRASLFDQDDDIFSETHDDLGFFELQDLINQVDAEEEQGVYRAPTRAVKKMVPPKRLPSVRFEESQSQTSSLSRKVRPKPLADSAKAAGAPRFAWSSDVTATPSATGLRSFWGLHTSNSPLHSALGIDNTSATTSPESHNRVNKYVTRSSTNNSYFYSDNFGTTRSSSSSSSLGLSAIGLRKMSGSAGPSPFFRPSYGERQVLAPGGKASFFGRRASEQSITSTVHDDDDGYNACFRKTLICVGGPINGSSSKYFTRTKSGRYIECDSDDVDSDEPNSPTEVESPGSEAFVLKERASTGTLKLSAHSAPWPTCVTPLVHPKLSLPQFRERVGQLYDEFALGGDYPEFRDQIRGLQSREYHDTLVSLIFRKSLDLRDDAALDYACAKVVLTKMAREKNNMVSQSSLFRGLYGWVAQIYDLERDVPHASFEMMNLIEHLCEEGILEATALCRMPQEMLEKAGHDKYANILKEMSFFKEKIHEGLLQFFESLNLRKLEALVGELNLPTYHHQIVYEAILLSMDFGVEERKVVARVFQRFLRQEVIVDEDIQHGIALAVGQLDELTETDVPHAKEYFVQVLTDCITCEVVSADLVKKFRMLQYGGLSGEAAFQQTLHRTPEYSRKLWGPDTSSGLSSLLEEIDNSIVEYLDSFDCEEVARIVGELHLSPDLDIYFIKQILLKCMEKDVVDPLAVPVLLHLKDVYWKTEDFESAIESIRNEQQDLVLDFPNIRKAANVMIESCLTAGLISAEFHRLAAIQYDV